MREKRSADAQLAVKALSAHPSAERTDAQGARVVPCCYPDAAATVRTEDAQSYAQYGHLTVVIKVIRLPVAVNPYCANLVAADALSTADLKLRVEAPYRRHAYTIASASRQQHRTTLGPGPGLSPRAALGLGRHHQTACGAHDRSRRTRTESGSLPLEKDE